MALALTRLSGSDRIINTNNIDCIWKTGDISNPKFKGLMMNGEDFTLNQIYYKEHFIIVRTMEQLYKLLSKLDSGVIQDGS